MVVCWVYSLDVMMIDLLVGWWVVESVDKLAAWKAES